MTQTLQQLISGLASIVMALQATLGGVPSTAVVDDFQGQVLGVTSPESFIGNDKTVLSSHDSNWVTPETGYPVSNFEIFNNQIRLNANWVTAGAMYNISNSDTSQIVIKASTVKSKFVCTRMGLGSNAKTGYCATFNTANSGNWTSISLVKNRGWLKTINISSPQNVDHTLKIVASGSSTVTVTVYVDDVSVGSFVDNSSPLGLGGHPGFFILGTGSQSGTYMDDWTDTGLSSVPVPDIKPPVIPTVIDSNITAVPVINSSTSTDTEPPVVNVIFPVSTTTLSSSVYSLKAVATDNVKLYYIQFYVDGQSYGAGTLYATMFNSFPYINGQHSVYAVAHDSSGNKSTSPTVTFNISNPIDTTPPVPPQNFSANLLTPTQAYLSWTSSGDFSGIKEYRIYRNDNLLTTIVSGISFTDNTISASQNYTYYVVVVDNKNNASSPSNKVSVSSLPQLSTVIHPRVLITPGIIASKKANLNTLSDWPALKAKADSYLNMTVRPYDSNLAGLTIGYRGDNHYSALLILALSYQLTGNVAYADKGIQIMEAMDQAGLCLFLGENKDSVWFKSLNCTSGKGDGSNGYPIRFYGTAMAIGYDWFYDRLSSAQKIAYYTQMNEWLDWYASYGFEKEGTALAGNFFGGYLEALALGGFATEGENPKAPEYISRARNFITGTVYPQFSPGGWFYGGNEPEGYSYGTGHFTRLLNSINVFKTAKGEDLFSNKKIPEQIAKFLLHATKPNMWQMIDSGEWGGTVGGITGKGLPLYLSQLLEGKEIGSEIEYYFRNIFKNPPALLYSVNYEASPFSKILSGDTLRPTKDYRSTESLSYQAEGTKQFFSRSGWDSNAVWASFHGGAKVFSVGHENKDNGSFTIQRGNDYLVVDGSSYRQPLGWSGMGVGGYDSCNENTLYFSDFGDYVPNKYCGGQTAGGDDVPNISENTSGYFYSKVDLTSAYDMSGWSKDATKKTLLRFERSFLHLRPDVFLVFDQVETRKPTYEKKFRLHFGNEPQISGDTLIASNGGSKVFVKTILPESALITKRFASVVRSSGNVNTTWETDSYNPNQLNSDNFLNVVYISPNNVLSMIPTNKIVVSSGNMQGVHIQNQGNHVVLFNANTVSAPVQNVSYGATTVTGQATHYLLGMQPNASFKVQKNAVDIGTIVSSSNGVLQFLASGNGTFTVQSLTQGDIISPTVSISAPSVPNSIITGKYTLKANATDNVSVSGVQFLVDNNPVGVELISSPYQFIWNSASVSNGNHSLSVRARDSSGNIKTSDSLNINVSNTTAIPLPPSSPISTKFTPNQKIKTTSNLSVRQTASATGTLLGTQPLGALGTIVNGGQSADSYYWWNINYDSGVDGYSVENYLSSYTAQIIGDFNSDGLVNSIDLSLLTSAWNTNNATYDLNRDNLVNSLDYAIMVQNWSL